MMSLRCAKAILIISITAIGNINLNAGQDCRSMLNAFITPLFGSENIVGGIEASGAVAGMTDRNVKNGIQQEAKAEKMPILQLPDMNYLTLLIKRTGASARYSINITETN